MNKVILIGRLTKDPTIRYAANEKQTAIANYTLAVDRQYKRDGEDNADFIGCTAFGRNAEFAEKYLRQGTKIAVTGQIQTGSYVNKDGKKVYTTTVIVAEHEFVESRRSSESGGHQAPQPCPENNDGFINIPEGIDEELPFT